MNDWTETLNLTEDEIAEGWHWCDEWDGLLVGPGMMELEPCKCLPDDHPAYKVPRPQVPENFEKAMQEFEQGKIEPLDL